MTQEGHRMDPADWSAFRREMHDLLDACVDHLEAARERPWRPVPEDFDTEVAISDTPRPVWQDLSRHILPQGTGNTHPAFFGWVHGTGQASGLAAELVAATMNANCGGRDHGAIRIEQAVLRWLCDTAGLPAGSGGILTTGTSQATLYALHAARRALTGTEIRKAGLGGRTDMRVYAAAGAHSCISQALDVMGHGRDALVTIPLCDGALDLDALHARITADRDAGLTPMAIIATAGSVNIGSFDDIAGITRLARAEGIWCHVDAAFGYWIRLAEAPWGDLAQGMEAADSIALDAHKWLGAPYACGACLVRDAHSLHDAFADRADYLRSSGDGLAGGAWWPTDAGLDLSRGFSALKVWTALQTHGRARIGAVVTDNCRQAALMGDLVEASDVLELARPVISNICVMRPASGTAPALAATLQMSGDAVFSDTLIDGQECLRAAIVNHRTTSDTIRGAIAALEHHIRNA